MNQIKKFFGHFGHLTHNATRNLNIRAVDIEYETFNEADEFLIAALHRLTIQN